jgi:hypothetical protein
MGKIFIGGIATNDDASQTCLVCDPVRFNGPAVPLRESEDPRNKLRFRVFEADLRTGELTKHGMPSGTLLAAFGAGLHRKLYLPEVSRVTPAVLLLALVTAERLAELWLARRNTAALLAKGAFEVAPGITR